MKQHVYIKLDLKVEGFHCVCKEDGSCFLSALVDSDSPDLEELRRLGLLVEDEADLPEDMQSHKHEFLGVPRLNKEEPSVEEVLKDERKR